MIPVSPRPLSPSINPPTLPGGPAMADAKGKTSASFEDLLGNPSASGSGKGEDPAPASPSDDQTKEDPAKTTAALSAAMVCMPWMMSAAPPPLAASVDLSAVPDAQSQGEGVAPAAQDAAMGTAGTMPFSGGSSSLQRVLLTANGGNFLMAASGALDTAQTLAQATLGRSKQSPLNPGVTPMPTPVAATDSSEQAAPNTRTVSTPTPTPGANAQAASSSANPGGRIPPPLPVPVSDDASAIVETAPPVTDGTLLPPASSPPPGLAAFSSAGFASLQPTLDAIQPTLDATQIVAPPAGPAEARAPLASTGRKPMPVPQPPAASVSSADSLPIGDAVSTSAPLASVGAGGSTLPQPIPGPVTRQPAAPSSGGSIALPDLTPAPAPVANTALPVAAGAVAAIPDMLPGRSLASSLHPVAAGSVAADPDMAATAAKANFAPTALVQQFGNAAIAQEDKQIPDNKGNTSKISPLGTTTAKSTVDMNSAVSSLQPAARNGEARAGLRADGDETGNNSTKGQGKAADSVLSHVSGGALAPSHEILFTASDAQLLTNTSSAAARAEDAAALLQRTAEAGERLRANGSGHIEVQAPMGNGENVTIRLHWENGSLHATFRTDSPELRQALERDWGQFTARCSQERGLPLSESARFEPSGASNNANSFSFGGGQNDSGNRQSSSQQPGEGEDAAISRAAYSRAFTNPRASLSAAAAAAPPVRLDRWKVWA